MLNINGHTVKGLYHTGIAYTQYYCVECDKYQTLPVGFQSFACE